MKKFGFKQAVFGLAFAGLFSVEQAFPVKVVGGRTNAVAPDLQKDNLEPETFEVDALPKPADALDTCLGLIEGLKTARAAVFAFLRDRHDGKSPDGKFLIRLFCSPGSGKPGALMATLGQIPANFVEAYQDILRKRELRQDFGNNIIDYKNAANAYVEELIRLQKSLASLASKIPNPGLVKTFAIKHCCLGGCLQPEAVRYLAGQGLGQGAIFHIGHGIARALRECERQLEILQLDPGGIGIGQSSECRALAGRFAQIVRRQ